MSVDVFGRSDIKSKIGVRGSPGIGYKLTKDGHYDISRKRLCNLAEALDDDDAVSLHVLKKRMTDDHTKVQKDITRNFKSSENLITEKITLNLHTEIKELTQKLDSDISLVINVINDFQVAVSNQLTQMQSDLENVDHMVNNLKNKFNL